MKWFWTISSLGAPVYFRQESVILKKIFLKIHFEFAYFSFFLRVGFHCREILTCVYTHVNFSRGNILEARVSSLDVKLSEVQLLCLRATFHTLKNYATVEIHPNTFGIERMNTFIQSCSSLENRTRFRAKTVFRPKRRKNSTRRIEDSPFLHSVVIATLRDDLFNLHSISLRRKARLDFQKVLCRIRYGAGRRSTSRDFVAGGCRFAAKKGSLRSARGRLVASLRPDTFVGREWLGKDSKILLRKSI